MKNFKLGTKEDYQQFLEALYEAVPDVILTTNAAGTIQFCNNSVKAMFKYTPEELFEKNISTLLSQRFAQENSQRISAYISGDCDSELNTSRRIEGRNQDGTIFPISLTAAEVFFNNVRYFTYIIRDIQHIVLTEQELEKRTTELARSNAALQNFAAIASHDLQAPLRTINSHVDGILSVTNCRLSSTSKDRLRRIGSACRRMRDLTDGLLALSRANNEIKEFGPVAIHEILDELVCDLATIVAEVKATITRGKLPIVIGNKGQLRQLLQNLLTNAIKFRHPNTAPVIHISATSNAKECTISVSDNGIGVDGKHHQSIFEMFRKLHSRSEYQGSGIGLALCKTIIERHGGTIWMTSNEGGGSCFSFTLPLAN